MNEENSKTLPPGYKFANRYEIVKKLGVGGMGEVYLAKDEFLDQTLIALKLLSQELCQSEVQVQRFLREVLLTRKVSSPNVVKTFEADISEERLYFTMEYIEGISLKEKIGLSSLDVEESCEILLSLAQGLSAIHQVDIVHRDLKPANILITKDHKIKIADFGVARTDRSELTAQDEVIGSSLYMAPESWTGKEASSKTDVYALGVVAYQMLTGICPFDGDSSAQIMYKHLEGDLMPVSELVHAVPSWLDNLIESMLALSPEDRPDLKSIIKKIDNYLNQEEDEEENINEERRHVELYERTNRSDLDSTLWDPNQNIAKASPAKIKKKLVNPDFGSANLEKKSLVEKDLSTLKDEFKKIDVSYKNIGITLLAAAIITFLLFEPIGNFLESTWKDLLKSKKSNLSIKAVIFCVNSIFYSFIIALPILIVSSAKLKIKKAIIRYLRFCLVCLGISIFITIIYSIGLFFEAKELKDLNPKLALAILNLSLPKSVNNLLEASLLFPFGSFYTPTTFKNYPALVAGNINTNLFSWIYFLVLPLYLFFFVKLNADIFNLKNIKLKKLIAIPLFLSFLLTCLSLLRYLTLQTNIFQINLVEAKLGVYNLTLDKFFLMTSIINWLLVVFAIFIIGILLKKQSTQAQDQ